MSIVIKRKPYDPPARVRRIQKMVGWFNPRNWVGANGYTCHQAALNYALYNFRPDLLRPIARRHQARFNGKPGGSLYFVAFLDVLLGHLILGKKKKFT